jgi:hypothetical protein
LKKTEGRCGVELDVHSSQFTAGSSQAGSHSSQWAVHGAQLAVKIATPAAAQLPSVNCEL